MLLSSARDYHRIDMQCTIYPLVCYSGVYQQYLQSTRRQTLPVQLINRALVRCQEPLACALVSPMAIGTIPPATLVAFIARQKPSRGLRWWPQ
jgi:hypothetical protein